MLKLVDFFKSRPGSIACLSTLTAAPGLSHGGEGPVLCPGWSCLKATLPGLQLPQL